MKIIPGKEEAYKEYVEINSHDDYSKACITAGERVGELLDKGKTPAQAEKGMYGLGLTGFMAAMVCRGIWKYHPRGEEFKSYWNKKHGGTGDENGTMNPAVMDIDVAKVAGKKPRKAVKKVIKKSKKK